MFFEELEDVQNVTDDVESMDDIGEVAPEAQAMEGVESVEPAPSMEIQAKEISEVFLDHPELQFENWQQLSPEERMEALQNFENEVAAIEHREALPVYEEPMQEGLLGYFTEADYSLHLNQDLVESNDYEVYAKMMETFVHEGRHAYQYVNTLEGCQVEQNSEWVNVWTKNFDEGDWGYRSAAEYGYDDYYMQPIEVDARAFAEEAMESMGLR